MKKCKKMKTALMGVGFSGAQKQGNKMRKCNKMGSGLIEVGFLELKNSGTR